LKDKNLWVRATAAKALGRIGDSCAVAALENMWRKDSSVLVKIWSAYALVRINKNQKAFQYLLTKLKDNSEEVCWQAVDALREIGDKRAVEPLIEALKDVRFGVRAHVMCALGEIGDKRAVEPLIEALKDEHKFVRPTAVEALEKITGQKLGRSYGRWVEWWRKQQKSKK